MKNDDKSVTTAVVLMCMALNARTPWFQTRLENLNATHYMDGEGYIYNEWMRVTLQYMRILLSYIIKNK